MATTQSGRPVAKVPSSGTTQPATATPPPLPSPPPPKKTSSSGGTKKSGTKKTGTSTKNKPAPITAGPPTPINTSGATGEERKGREPETEEEMANRRVYNLPSTPTLSGDPQVVFVLMFALLLLVGWNTIWKQLFQLAWNPSKQGSQNPSITSIPWKSSLGMIFFLLVMVFLATISDAMAGLMIIMASAMIVVYLVENNGGGLTTLFNWFGAGGTTTTTTGTGGPGGHQNPVQ